MSLLKSGGKMRETIKAFKIAAKAHKGQKDKGGKPYIWHPVIVAATVNDMKAIPIALLHDVVEDTEITIEQIYECFSKETAEAVELLTKKPGLDYEKYLIGIKQNPLATAVKVADIKHNSNIKRISKPHEKDFKRLEKYKKALKILED